MAGDWIKMRTNLGTDPDVICIAASLGLDEFSVVGRLHAMWAWLDSHSDDGTNVRVSSGFLDRLAGLSGFSEAMRAVGWIGGKDGAIHFPGYQSHNGNTAKSRALETKRKQLRRDKCPTRNGTNVPPSAGPEKRRVEKRRNKKPQPLLAMPEGVSPERTTALGVWLEYKREKGKTYQPMGWQALMTEIAGVPDSELLPAISTAMARNWDGFFPKPAAGQKPDQYHIAE